MKNLDQQLNKDTNLENFTNLNLRSLDALRGFLAVYVLLGHCRWLLWCGMPQWSLHSHPWWANLLAYASSSLRYGHEVVMIFFVLSGFFIHLRVAKQLVLLNKTKIKFDLVNFFKRRCHRLVPPYIFALVLTVILDLFGNFFYSTLYLGLTGDTLLDNNFQRKGFSLTSIIPAILMLPSSLGRDFGTNGPLWSLAYEVFYYMIYPLWLSVRRLGILPAYGLGILLAIAAGYYSLDNAFFKSVLIHYPIWLSGSLIAEVFNNIKINKTHIFISLLFLIFSCITIPIKLPLMFLIMNYSILGSSVVIAVLAIPKSIHYNRLHTFFELTGIESYTIYICHFPIITLISAWSIDVLGSRPLHGWLVIGGAIITLLITHLCFLVCERHFLHQRLKNN